MLKAHGSFTGERLANSVRFCYKAHIDQLDPQGGIMRQLLYRGLLLVLVCAALSGCIVKVRPIPVLEIHPFELELDD